MSCEKKKKSEVVCEMCGGKEVKYRCPSCLKRTCSLQCVKNHKKTYGCDGIRCRTSYVSKDDYNDNNMINDYRFLEDTERVSYSAGSAIREKPRHLNRSATTLLKKARQNGVALKLMPIGMSKRMINTSHFNNRLKSIIWRVRWLFPHADAEYVDKRVLETSILLDLLSVYIDANKGDPVILQRLKPYLQTPVERVSVFLKMEYQPANKERYYLLDTSKSLRDCLSGKTIIEFPTLHVVLPEKAHLYELVQESSERKDTQEMIDSNKEDIERTQQPSLLGFKQPDTSESMEIIENNIEKTLWDTGNQL